MKAFSLMKNFRVLFALHWEDVFSHTVYKVLDVHVGLHDSITFLGCKGRSTSVGSITYAILSIEYLTGKWNDQ